MTKLTSIRPVQGSISVRTLGGVSQAAGARQIGPGIRTPFADEGDNAGFKSVGSSGWS